MNTAHTSEPRRSTREQEPGSASAIGPLLGLTAGERERASIANFARASVEDNRGELAFFAEITAQVAKTTGRQPRGFQSYLVPGDVTGPGRRDMNKATAWQGGYLTGTGIEGFSHSLDTASLIGRLPMTRLPGMVGDATITRESIKGTAGWLAGENAVVPDAQSNFGSIALTPKTVGGSVVVTRQLLRQTGPAGAAFIDRALATTVAEAVDRALIAGSGAAGAPLGLAGLAGIDARSGSSFSWAMAAAMAKVAGGWAATDSLAWVAGVDAAAILKTRERAAGSGFIAEANAIDGRPLIVSRSVGASVLVAMPWSQFWMASWGALELAADPTTFFSTGRVQLRCLWSVDFAVENAAAVAIATAVS